MYSRDVHRLDARDLSLARSRRFSGEPPIAERTVVAHTLNIPEARETQFGYSYDDTDGIRHDRLSVMFKRRERNQPRIARSSDENDGT
jgi:hypothetical protein